MRTLGTALLAAMLAGSAPSVAGDQGSAPKPASYVPHSRSTHHVYGAPIARPILGHAKSPHPKRAKQAP